MNEESEKPDQPLIPPPDLPAPAASGKEPPVLGETAKPQTPLVAVRIREPGASEENSPLAGAIAPFNTRIIAAVIDSLVAGGLAMAVAWILPGFAAKIAWLVGMGYLVTRDSLPFLGGRSVGKTAMKLKVETEDGKTLTGNWEAALIRNAVLIIPFFALIELFVLLSREDKPGRGRRLGDEWAKTRVIVAPDPVKTTD